MYDVNVFPTAIEKELVKKLRILNLAAQPKQMKSTYRGSSVKVATPKAGSVITPVSAHGEILDPLMY